MAWLLVQKAVHAGEITRIEAAEPKHRLAGKEICEVTGCIDMIPLQPGLMQLLERSHRLYQRVARLDSMLDRVS
jgi:regulator of CtrA degradation